jgi:hypothetical protein
MPLAFYTPMMNVYENYNDVLIGSPLLLVRGAARVKSIRVERDIDRKPLAFCIRHCVCKKYKSRMRCRLGGAAFCMRHSACKKYKTRIEHGSGAPYFLYALIHWSCVRLGVGLLHQLVTRC